MEKIEGVLKWWPVILIAGQMILGWMQWKLSQRFATKKELEAHDVRIGDVEGKVTIIESDLRHMPTSEDICELKLTIAAHTEIYKALKASVKRFEDYLISEGQKK